MLKEGQFRNHAGCAISAIFNEDGTRISGEAIINSIAVMHDRSNGLGGGFAAYGIYPDKKDYFAFHFFFYSLKAKQLTEEYLKNNYDINSFEEIPTRDVKSIKDRPLCYRYFVLPNKNYLLINNNDENECVLKTNFYINNNIENACIFSSGKNMGVFKAVGYPEEVGDYFMLETYKAYLWTAHGRYPTNTPGWWGGSHPFNLLNLSVVHNGEISSYDTNRKAMEMYGYKCSLLTDTEVITYILDYLNRRKGLSFDEIAKIISSPFWFEIDRMNEKDKELLNYFRINFSSLLITGPFSIIVGFDKGVMAINDRIKLRALVSVRKGNTIYLASEESAIKAICKDFDEMKYVQGGEPVTYFLKEEKHE